MRPIVTTAIRLILMDVDGTLLGRNGVHPSTWSALDEARAQGVRLGLCTGRPAGGTVREYARQIAPHEYHIFESGAVVTKPDEPAAFMSLLPREALAELVALSRTEREPLEVYAEERYYLEWETEETRIHSKHLGMQPELRDPLTVTEPIIRAEWLASDERWPRLRALTLEVSGIAINPATAPWLPGTIFSNLTRAGTSKASALRWIADAYGLETGQVAMIGDGENDLDAIEAAGLGIAMENAPNSVKARAQHLVGDADEGGLAEAIRLALRHR